MKKIYKYGIPLLVSLLTICVLWFRFFFAQGAELVIRAKILDPRTIVSASSNQTYVATGQGWPAIKVEVRTIFTGNLTNGVIWLENHPHRGGKSPVDWETWECKKNKTYFFALRRSADLSKWCQMEIFEIVNKCPED